MLICKCISQCWECYSHGNCDRTEYQQFMRAASTLICPRSKKTFDWRKNQERIWNRSSLFICYKLFNYHFYNINEKDQHFSVLGGGCANLKSLLGRQQSLGWPIETAYQHFSYILVHPSNRIPWLFFAVDNGALFSFAGDLHLYPVECSAEGR